MSYEEMEKSIDKHMDKILSLMRELPESDSNDTLKSNDSQGRKPQLVGWGFCLICKEDGLLKGLTQDHFVNGEIENYSKMLHSCYNIQFQLEAIEKSKKSDGICRACIKSLKDALIFKERVELAYNHLHLYMKIDTAQLKSSPNNTNKEIKGETNAETINLMDDSNSDNDYFDNAAPSTSLPSLPINVEKAKPKPYKPEVSPVIQNPLPTLLPTDTSCPLCEEKFSDHESLLKHYSVHYMTFNCNVCSFTCVTKVGMLKHQSSHTQKRFKCKICKKTYANRSAATQHVRSVHNGVKIYVCIECPERFSDYFARNQHMTKIHGLPGKTYICPHCGKDFNRSSRLSEHIRRDHIKIKRHTCTECDQKFFSSNELKEHQLKHSGIKNFHCNACGKSYARKKTLTEHLKIHANLREHVCHICGKDFIQKCTLRSHLQTHVRDCSI